MKDLSFKNIIKLTKFNLYINRKTIIGWTIGIFLIMTLYMGLFDSIKDMAKLEIEVMPEEVLKFIGVSDIFTIGQYNGYFGMVFSLVLIAISVFAITFSISLIVKEEKTKSIEFLNSLHISRKEIYISKYLTSFIGILTVIFFALLITVICGYLVGGDTFNMTELMTTSKIACITPFIFGSIGFLLAGVSSKVATGAIGSGVVIASYMFGYLGSLLGDKGENLEYLSPFTMLNVKNVLTITNETAICLTAYFTIYVLSLVIGGYIYNKRDLNI